MSLFEWIYNIAIGLFGLYVLFRLTGVNKRFSELEKKSSGIYRQTKGKFKIDPNSFSAGYDVRNDLDSEAMDKIREDFNAESTTYYSHVQLISLFPLAGLLGTVIGLMPGLRAVQNEDFSLLYTSLSTALSSTMVGLVASIILKLYVANGPSKVMNDIENNLEENDRKLNYAVGFQKIAEGALSRADDLS